MTLDSFRLALLATWLLASPSGADDWPQWGGPNRDFTTPQGQETELADHWGESGPRLLWRRPLGNGLSSLTAVDGLLYTMYGRDGEEIIVALDAMTGETRWQHSYPVELHHEYAKSFHQGPNSTPAVTAGHVVAVGFTGQLHGLDANSGEMRWSYDLVEEFGARRLRFGHAASPLIAGDRVIVLAGGATGALSLDPTDGKVIWRSPPLDVSYASPTLARVDGKDQVVFLSAEEILAVSAESGALLWRAPCRNGFANNASDPIFGAGRFLWIASQPGCGARVLELRSYQGVTHVKPLWDDAEISLHYWNALRRNDTIYASIGHAGTDFSAIDFHTGSVLWQEQRFEKARILHADDKMILLDETGKLALIKPSRRRLEILGQYQLLDGAILSAPTLVGTTLFVRDESIVLALDLSPLR